MVLICLGGCGSGGDSVAGASGTSALKSFGWYYENVAPDFWSSGETCVLTVVLYYDPALSQSEIAGFVVQAPGGGGWSVNAPNLQFGTSSSGKPYIIERLSYSSNPAVMPLAGTWTAQLKLTNGQVASLQRSFHEPGSSLDATHPYLYTKEDWWAPSNQQYVASLGRFPSSGYSVQFSPANGGAINTVGFGTVRAGYLAAEPAAYNFFCWLYDANHVYLGYTNTAYSTLDHSPTNLVGTDGELAIVPASVAAASSGFNLSNVKYLRIVYTDGGQFAPTTYSSYDYRSISSLIPVNLSQVYTN